MGHVEQSGNRGRVSRDLGHGSRLPPRDVHHLTARGEDPRVSPRGGGRLVQLRHGAYLAAWLYLCAWIVASSLGWVPASLRLAGVGLTAAAVLLILTVLLAPRPTRTPVSASDLAEVGLDAPHAAHL